MHSHWVICPVGLNGSGKGNFCEILSANHGFISLSTSDVIRGIVAERGLPLTRENMGLTANELRKVHGKDYFTSLLAEQMDLAGFDYVIDGCRQVEEIALLQRKFPERVRVVKIYCDPHLRFERMKARNRQGDPQTYEEFLYGDEIEMGNIVAANSMNYKACFDLATYTIENNGTRVDLESSISKFVDSLTDK